MADPSRLERLLEAAESKIAALEHELAGIRITNDISSANVDEWRRRVVHLEAARDQLIRERNAAIAAANQREAQVMALKARTPEVELIDAHAKIGRMQRRLDEWRTKHGDALALSARLDQALASKASLEQELAQLRGEVLGLRAANRDVQRDRSERENRIRLLENVQRQMQDALIHSNIRLAQLEFLRGSTVLLSMDGVDWVTWDGRDTMDVDRSRYVRVQERAGEPRVLQKTIDAANVKMCTTCGNVLKEDRCFTCQPLTRWEMLEVN